jgi:antitoxin (DNA-binding transcriptional repressor) of toxin-antitoxin stability system
MAEMSKTKLKAHMLKVFREIERSGEPLIVTDRGKPTLRIEPIQRKRSVEEVFGHLRGKVHFTGDPDEPTAGEWEGL